MIVLKVAPTQVDIDKTLSLDEANVATHKTFQFVGLEPLKTYSVHDIFKGDLDLNKELVKFEETLRENFL